MEMGSQVSNAYKRSKILMSSQAVISAFEAHTQLMDDMLSEYEGVLEMKSNEIESLRLDVTNKSEEIENLKAELDECKNQLASIDVQIKDIEEKQLKLTAAREGDQELILDLKSKLDHQLELNQTNVEKLTKLGQKISPLQTQTQSESESDEEIEMEVDNEQVISRPITPQQQQVLRNDLFFFNNSSMMHFAQLTEEEMGIEHGKLTPEQKMKIKKVICPEIQDLAITSLISNLKKYDKNLHGETYLGRRTRFLHDQPHADYLTFSDTFDEPFISLYIASLQTKNGFGSKDLTKVDKYSASFLLWNMVVGEARLLWHTIQEPIDIINALLQFAIENRGNVRNYKNLKVTKTKTNYNWKNAIKNYSPFKRIVRQENVARLMHTAFMMGEKTGKSTGIPYQRFGFTLHGFLDGFNSDLNEIYLFKKDHIYKIWNEVNKRKIGHKISVPPHFASKFPAGTSVDHNWEENVQLIRENWYHFINLDEDTEGGTGSEEKKFVKNKKEAERRFNLGFRVSRENIDEQFID